ncbi:MAG: hypothetical protein WAM60_23120 [Candidatus Promineifilaceae bacterium]
MLDHLRQRVVDILSSTHHMTLSTYGAAELQATSLPCESAGMVLYILLPATSDHLLNLQSNAEVVVTTTDWQLRGTAELLDKPPEKIMNRSGRAPELALLKRPEAQWSRLLKISPYRLHLRRQNGWGYSETIDIDMS